MLAPLNWQEISRLAELLRPEVEGLFVDRLIVPERERFPGGYIKGEFALRLTGRRKEAFLVFSIRPRQPYFAYGTGKGPRAAQHGTQSPFSLSVAKHLKGAKVLGLEALPRERVLVLWTRSPDSADERLGLVLCLIPAVPEALLVRDPGDASRAPGWPVVSRSRVTASGPYLPPDGAKAPAAPPVREELLTQPEALLSALERQLLEQAFELRLQEAVKGTRDLAKQARERARQSDTARREAEREPDWRRYGDLLKAALPSPPEPQGSPPARALTDYVTGESVSVPSDPKLSPREQVEKFYQHARRKARRLQEAATRAENFAATAERLERSLERPPAQGDWAALERLERSLRLRPGASGAPAEGAGKPRKGGKSASWLGKTFESRDGLAILVGRSRDENLELTFKHARGNDAWLHVRGRPGAHVVVPLQPGKSVPLETLLDAAVLAIYYSGGESWGKTEVDYTFKKHVRRIKDSTEASYTHNKTLIVEPDPARIKRLLATAES